MRQKVPNIIQWFAIILFKIVETVNGLVFICSVMPVRDVYLHACCKQVLFLVASVCLSARNHHKLLVGNQCNLVGICPMQNARSG